MPYVAHDIPNLPQPKWWGLLQQANEEKATLQATIDKKAMWPPALAQAAQVATWTPLETPTGSMSALEL